VRAVSYTDGRERGAARTRKGRLLRRVALQRQALGFVLDVVRSDGRVVRDLLDGEVGLAAPVLVRPVAEEKPARGSDAARVGGVRATYSPRTGFSGL
jgi:hypothetical protein